MVLVVVFLFGRHVHNLWFDVSFKCEVYKLILSWVAFLDIAFYISTGNASVWFERDSGLHGIYLCGWVVALTEESHFKSWSYSSAGGSSLLDLGPPYNAMMNSLVPPRFLRPSSINRVKSPKLRSLESLV